MNGPREILQEDFCKGNLEHIRDAYDYLYPVINSQIITMRGSYDDAFDIFHEVICEICTATREEKIKIKKSFISYFITTCINRWKNERKKRRRQNIINREYHENIHNRPEVDEIAEGRKYSIFRKYLSKQRKDDRRLIELIIAGKSNSEIAQKMKFKNIEAVETKKCRLLKKMKLVIVNDPFYCKFLLDLHY